MSRDLENELKRVDERIRYVEKHLIHDEAYEELTDLVEEKSRLEIELCDYKYGTHRVKVEKLYKKLSKQQLKVQKHYNLSKDALDEHRMSDYKFHNIRYLRALSRVNRYKRIIDHYDELDCGILGLEAFNNIDKHITMV